MRFVNAYGRAALYATIVATVTLALMEVIVDGRRGFGELFATLAVALYVFPITLAVGVPVHVLFAALRIDSAVPYTSAGAVLGGVVAILFFRGAGTMWLLPVSIGFAVAGAVAALTFWRHYVVPQSGRLTSA